MKNDSEDSAGADGNLASGPGGATGEGSSPASRWIMRGVLAITSLLSLPLVVVLYVTAALGGTALAATSLHYTNGLQDSTFFGAFWLALIAALLGGAGGLFLRYKWRNDESKSVRRFLVQPAVSFLLVFCVPAGLMTLIEVGDVDVPDRLSTTAILGAIAYLWVVLPVALSRVGWKALRALHDWGSASSERSTIVSLGAPIALLAGGLVMAGPFGLGAQMSDPGLDGKERVGITEDEDAEGIAEETQYALASFALSTDDESEENAAPLDLPSANVDISAASTKRRDLFYQCYEELNEEDFGGNSDFTQVRQWLERNAPRWAKSRDPEIDYDLAVEALVKTCRKFEKTDGDIDDLGPYFQRVVENELKQYIRDHKREPIDRYEERPEKPVVGFDDEMPRERFRKCLRRLDDETAEQLVVFLVHDQDYGEFANAYEITRDTAYARISRARGQVKAKCRDLR